MEICEGKMNGVETETGLFRMSESLEHCYNSRQVQSGTSFPGNAGKVQANDQVFESNDWESG